MIKLYDNGVYLLNGTEIVEDTGNVQVSTVKRRSGAQYHGVQYPEGS